MWIKKKNSELSMHPTVGYCNDIENILLNVKCAYQLEININN